MPTVGHVNISSYFLSNFLAPALLSVLPSFLLHHLFPFDISSLHCHPIHSVWLQVPQVIFLHVNYSKILSKLCKFTSFLKKKCHNYVSHHDIFTFWNALDLPSEPLPLLLQGNTYPHLHLSLSKLYSYFRKVHVTFLGLPLQYSMWNYSVFLSYDWSCSILKAYYCDKSLKVLKQRGDRESHPPR